MTDIVNFQHEGGDAPLGVATSEGDTLRVEIKGELVDFTLLGAGMSPGLPRVAIHAVSDEGIEILIELPLVRLVMAAQELAAMARRLGDPSVP
jgi:hypothetical protein